LPNPIPGSKQIFSGKTHLLNIFANKYNAEFISKEVLNDNNPLNIFANNKFFIVDDFSEINDLNSYLVFVGSDESKLSARILNICADKIKKIRILGFSKEPYKYLASANVLCLPRYREGFGSVIIEAAAMSVPAIGSNIYGITDAIQPNKTGLLHEPRDILGIKMAMEYLLHKPLLFNKLKKAAKKRAVDKFDANKVTDHWLKFYSRYVN
jgi:glycosyltransferase involved in cell wall biosynthesis